MKPRHCVTRPSRSWRKLDTQLVAAGLVMLLSTADARAEAGIDFAGPVGPATTMTLADLAALPPGPPQPHFSGPTLWSVLQKSGLVAQDFHGRVRQVLTVTGQDGYSVVIAMAEIDPEFENKGVLVAVRRDDAPLDAPRLVVPGDKRAGRSVHDVAKVELR